MSHAYHEGLPGYSPAQILHDGCDECEQRAAREDRGISSLDPVNYALAVARAWQLESEGLTDASDAEIPMLRVLSSVRNQRVRTGVVA